MWLPSDDWYLIPIVVDKLHHSEYGTVNLTPELELVAGLVYRKLVYIFSIQHLTARTGIVDYYQVEFPSLI